MGADARDNNDWTFGEDESPYAGAPSRGARRGGRATPTRRTARNQQLYIVPDPAPSSMTQSQPSSSPYGTVTGYDVYSVETDGGTHAARAGNVIPMRGRPAPVAPASSPSPAAYDQEPRVRRGAAAAGLRDGMHDGAMTASPYDEPPFAEMTPAPEPGTAEGATPRRRAGRPIRRTRVGEGNAREDAGVDAPGDARRLSRAERAEERRRDRARNREIRAELARERRVSKRAIKRARREPMTVGQGLVVAASSVLVAAMVVAILYPPAQGLYSAYRTKEFHEQQLAELKAHNDEMRFENESLMTREGIMDKAAEYGYVEQGSQLGKAVAVPSAGSATAASAADDAATSSDAQSDPAAPAKSWAVNLLDQIFHVSEPSPLSDDKAVTGEDIKRVSPGAVVADDQATTDASASGDAAATAGATAGTSASTAGTAAATGTSGTTSAVVNENADISVS